MPAYVMIEIFELEVKIVPVCRSEVSVNVREE